MVLNISIGANTGLEPFIGMDVGFFHQQMIMYRMPAVTDEQQIERENKVYKSSCIAGLNEESLQLP